jgi:hypothetical protein
MEPGRRRVSSGSGMGQTRRIRIFSFLKSPYRVFLDEPPINCGTAEATSAKYAVRLGELAPKLTVPVQLPKYVNDPEFTIMSFI